MCEKQLTLGSLFDGSGGFPLAGLLNGIRPVWASEVAPFPILVTAKRLPEVKHYGDISTLNGAELEPVDIITFGSPCTSLSVAGLRAGLEGKQSVLFFQAIRIIKEMREQTHGRYPRWICWENVFGVFSSGQGRDLQRVLEEIIGIVVPQATVPAPDGYCWPYADVYWATDGALRTELLMRNGMEFPNGVAVVTLSQILEANVPVTYYLSATACAGILRRASARGKTLPEILRLALERQSRERNPFTA